MEDGDVAQLVECSTSMHKAQAQSSASQNIGTVTQVYNPSAWKVRTEESKVQSHGAVAIAQLLRTPLLAWQWWRTSSIPALRSL